jgi:anti-sigma B factor antagonist
MSTTRPVIVMELPEQLNVEQVQILCRELLPLVRADRPRLVFDFSRVRRIDSAGVDMLLTCIDEVMKRDGDLKLASLPPEVGVILEMTRVDRLFEIFDEAADAVESFHHFPPYLERANSFAAPAYDRGDGPTTTALVR